MPKFLVLVQATNFLMRSDAEVAPHGAFTARIVKATDETAACQAAYASVSERITQHDSFVSDPAYVPTFATVLVKQVFGLRRVRGYALVLYEQGDEIAETEAQAIAEEAVGVSSAN